MIAKKVAIIILSALGGIALALVFNLILYKILIPDPCYYHDHDTNRVFDIFYELTAGDGYHPFPTKFNFVLTATIGAIFGLTFSIYRLKKRDTRKTTEA